MPNEEDNYLKENYLYQLSSPAERAVSPKILWLEFKFASLPSHIPPP